MISRFSAGQLVKVSAPRCLAYGRYGLVLTTRGDQSQIRFADLPKASQHSQSSVGFVQFFSYEDIELVEGRTDCSLLSPDFGFHFGGDSRVRSVCDHPR